MFQEIAEESENAKACDPLIHDWEGGNFSKILPVSGGLTP
jgi:hypothetical protein